MLKIQADYTKEIFNLPEANFDLVYFDAFAPEKQPNMWQEELFQRLYVIMKPNRLTTYCVKGNKKNDATMGLRLKDYQDLLEVKDKFYVP